MTEQVFGEMSEEFDFDEDGMDYLDGPLTGWLRRKRDGAWFAYDCQPIIADKLWHWTLVSVPMKTDDVTRVLVDARRVKSDTWLSIVEDRRSSASSTCRLVSIENSTAAPVIGVVERETTDKG